MAVDTKRQEYVEYYFQQVQEKIKELLSKDKHLKDADIQKFNDEIFTQKNYEVRKDLQAYIEGAATNTVDLEAVARQILDKYYDMVFANSFTQDTVNDIENPLEENKRIMNFSQFNEKL